MPAVCPTCLVPCIVQNMDGDEVYQCPSCHHLYPKIKSGPTASPAPAPSGGPAKSPPRPPRTQAPAGERKPNIEFFCPHCGHPIKVPGKFAGKKGQCEKCKQVVKIPSTSVVTVAAKPAPAPAPQDVPPTAPLPVIPSAPAAAAPAPAAEPVAPVVEMPAQTTPPPAPPAVEEVLELEPPLDIVPAAPEPPPAPQEQSAQVEAVSAPTPVEQPAEPAPVMPPGQTQPEPAPAAEGVLEFEIPLDAHQPESTEPPELMNVVNQEPESITTKAAPPTTPPTPQEPPSQVDPAPTPASDEPAAIYEAKITQDDGKTLQYNCPRCNCLLATPVERRGLVDQCPDCQTMIQIPITIIRFQCGKCSQPLEAPAEMGGLTSKCPACGAIGDIPFTPAQQRQQEILLKAEMARIKQHKRNT